MKNFSTFLIIICTSSVFSQIGFYNCNILKQLPVEKMIQGEWELTSVEIEGLNDNHSDTAIIKTNENGKDKLIIGENSIQKVPDTITNKYAHKVNLNYSLSFSEFDHDSVKLVFVYLNIETSLGNKDYRILYYSYDELIFEDYDSGDSFLDNKKTKVIYRYKKMNQEVEKGFEKEWFSSINPIYWENDTLEKTYNCLTSHGTIYEEISFYQKGKFSTIWRTYGSIGGGYGFGTYVINNKDHKIYCYKYDNPNSFQVYDYRFTESEFFIKKNVKETMKFNEL